MLNLVVVVDRDWKEKITANRLQRVGRYNASRTVLCAVEDGRQKLDARAVMRYEEPSNGAGLGVILEEVEIDLGPDQLEHLDTVIDPVIVSELPTMLWSPHGHDEAVRAVLELVDVILLDSDDLADPPEAFARATELLRSAYVVDLAWLRTTPWRERLAASFDPPNRRATLNGIANIVVRHQPASAASAALPRRLAVLTTSLASGAAQLGQRGRTGGSVVDAPGREVEIELEPVEQEVPGLVGVTVGCGERFSLSLDRGPGGLRARELPSDRTWRVLGASRGEGRNPGGGRKAGAVARPDVRARTVGGAETERLSGRLDVLADPAAACAELMVSSAQADGHIVLTGGSTPGDAYQRAAENRDAWRGATLWFGDERCVPPDDDLSNFKLANEALFERLGDIRPTVHRMRGELGPAAAADEYERELLDAGPPRFDLLLLGLGPDAHIASLFPDQETLWGRSRLVVGVEQAGHEPFVPRVSMTLKALTLARSIVFLVAGESKADAVAAAFGPDAKPDPHFPASLLPPLTGEITVLLDEAAASRIPAGEQPMNVIGVDLGGTKTAAAHLHDDRLEDSQVQSTELSSSDALIDQVSSIIAAMRDDGLQAVGIGVPSIVEFATGRVISSVNVPLKDVPMRRVLGEKLGVPVFVDNDATVAAFAEAHDEQLRMVARDLVMLTVGTGVGGGIVIDGRIFRGATGAAGELGHTIVGLDLAGSVPSPMGFPQPGSLEFVASGHALDELARQAANLKPAIGAGPPSRRGQADPGRGCRRGGARRRRVGVPDGGDLGRARGDRRGECDQHVRSGRGGDRWWRRPRR